MFSLIIITMTLPPISHQLTIKVQGKVNVGDQISDFLQDICKLFENLQKDSVRPKLTPEKKMENSKHKQKDDTVYNFTPQNEKTSKGKNYINVYMADNKFNNVKLDKTNAKAVEEKEISLLDEIIGKHNLGKVHVYGKHDKKAERYQRPLNNINV